MVRKNQCNIYIPSYPNPHLTQLFTEPPRSSLTILPYPGGLRKIRKNQPETTHQIRPKWPRGWAEITHSRNDLVPSCPAPLNSYHSLYLCIDHQKVLLTIFSRENSLVSLCMTKNNLPFATIAPSKKNVRLCRTNIDLEANCFHKELKCEFCFVMVFWWLSGPYSLFDGRQICRTTDHMPLQRKYVKGPVS